MPDPFLIEVAIEPKFRVDQKILDVVLAKLAAEDLSFGFVTDQESGQTILKGMDELHLDTKVDILKRTCDFDIHIGAPQVAYREKLAKRVEIDETHKKQTAGSGQFARVKIIFEPCELGTGSSFESTVASGAVPKEYIQGVEKGINSVMRSGILAGFPLADVKATLIDGAFYDVDSLVLAFEICARAAFRRALKEGGSVLLEPMMKVEVTAPEDYLGSVTGDLLSRRGQIQGRESRSNLMIINATVPLSNLFGYVNQLRSFTQGFGTYTMRFSHYADAKPVLPPDDGRFPPAVGMRASSGRNFEDWKLDLVQSNIVRL